MVGFRFLDHTRGLEVPGYHLHRRRRARARRPRAGLPAEQRRGAWTCRPTLHVELSGVEIGTTDPDEDEIRGVEG